MLFYISVLLFVSFIGILQEEGYRIPYVNTLVFMVLWLAAGTSHNFGIDNTMYKEMYDNPDHLGNTYLEPIWAWLADGLRASGLASRGWFLLTSLLIMSFFFYGIKRLSSDYWFSMILFVAGYFYFESMNGIRQYCAISIVFAATHWVFKNQIWKYLLAVILAAQFHTSAYIMLPMIFVCKTHFPNWLLGGAMLITFFIGSQLMGIILKFLLIVLDVGRYENYVDNMVLDGVSSGLLKVFLNCIGGLVLLTASQVKSVCKEHYIYINMVIIGIVIYNIFYSFQVVMRTYWYFYPFIIILFPLILKSFTRKSRVLLTILVVLIFSVFQLKMLYIVKPDYSFDLKLFENSGY